MVEFVTLFLGLVAGPLRVELAVDGPVHAVVLELDGEAIGRVSEAPWELSVDLGSELLPHRLEASALDARGVELDRATQFLNVPRPPAEASFLLRRDGSDRVTSLGLTWESRVGARPLQVTVSLDGRPLRADDPDRIELPPLDPAQLHVIEAEVVFTNGVVARDYIGVGGRFLDQASARLTAVPHQVASAEARPEPRSLVVRPTRGGAPLRVVAVERGKAEIVFVRDRQAGEALKRLITIGRAGGSLSGVREALVKKVIETVPILPDEEVRVLYPLGIHRAGARLDHSLFPVTPPIEAETGGGVYWHLTTQIRIEGEKAEPRLADAVAIAGSQAATGNHRRIVVLLLAPGSKDEGSRFEPDAVRRYHRALGVDFEAWYLGKAGNVPKEWGEARIVRTVAALEEAMAGVRAKLDHQRMVWVEGLHLPAELSVLSADQGGS